MNHLGVARNDVGALLWRDGGVFKEATGIAQDLGIGQFVAANFTDPIKYLLGARVGNARVGHFAFQVQIAHHGLPRFR